MTKAMCVWPFEEEEPEDVVDMIETAGMVTIWVEDGSFIYGNARDGFRWVEGDEIPAWAFACGGGKSRS